MRRVEAVIFDWAGTVADFGSLAPVRAVTEVFARRGMTITDEEARRDMGIFKKDHIRRILCARNGAPPREEEVESMFEEFQPIQMETLAHYSKLIAGAPQIAAELRGQEIKIGSTTGYTRPMLDMLAASAKEQGYDPDIALCPDDVSGGRPLPWMCLTIALKFGLSSVACAVKVGDTVSDIEEGRNAGMWTIGVTRTGNEVGLSEAQFDALPAAEQESRIAAAAAKLEAAGAHFTVQAACDIQPALAEIGRRLRAGLNP